MIPKSIYRVFDNPYCYQVAQTLLAPGSRRNILRYIENLTKQIPLTGKVLDVGCGPTSWLQSFDCQPFGLDLTHEYSRALARSGGVAITASADFLPFFDNIFQSVWSIGMLHHLPEQIARASINEMCRVCAWGGNVVILDAVLPNHAWGNPLAWLIRKMDRGNFMRTQTMLNSLLTQPYLWKTSRITYTYNGLEILSLCWKKKYE